MYRQRQSGERERDRDRERERQQKTTATNVRGPAGGQLRGRIAREVMLTLVRMLRRCNRRRQTKTRLASLTMMETRCTRTACDKNLLHLTSRP